MKTVWNISNAMPTTAFNDPKNPSRLVLPAGATDIEPPSFDAETQTCSFAYGTWVVTDIPAPEPEPTPEPVPAIDQLRFQRNALLAETDWWVLPDRTATQEQLDYRQVLRDLPSNNTPALDENGQLIGVDWPTPPEN